MRKSLGNTQLGERGTLFFWQEDMWTYPEISFDADNGESASISLQHMSSKQIHQLADDIKRIAIKAEEHQKPSSNQPSIIPNPSPNS